MRTQNKRQVLFCIIILVIGIMFNNSCNSAKNKNFKTEENLIPVAEKTIDIDLSLGRMTIVLNFVKKDRIPLMGDFFEKVLPRLPISKIFSRKKK
ncbi:hypothetical protein [Flavobacterium sp. LC2016-13]|uniref:hypothetical protein n=1 Tax=Flavobacterium sp. LC2016-13 TaxID=2675875 RepID=UPI0012B7654E|nr:hypothetical protein [Flavobacterium sp. LC2016-13]MTD67771.1 hypothetical protein [Flavobacterium sp. LC2016-13]